MFKRSRTFLFIVALLITSLVAGVGPQRAQGVTSSQPASLAQTPAPDFSGATIPFDLVTRHIALKVKVNDSRPLSFIFDTGDQFAIINLELARELGLNLSGSISVGGAGAERAVGSIVKEASFTIPALPGFSQPVNMALPLTSLSSRLGQDFDGIIGSEFIKHFVVEIDYQAHVLKLHNKTKFVYSGSGQSIPIQLVNGHPILNAEVTPVGGEPIKGRFVLDLGAGIALALYSPFVGQHQLLGPNARTVKMPAGAGTGGETQGRVGRVLELKIGNYKIAEPITLFSEDKAGAFATSTLAGNIGARIAGKFRLFLDYSRNQIIFEPNSTFADPLDYALTGASIIAEGSDYRTFRVREVVENSAASEAGLQKDDIVVAVNGRPASAMTLSHLNDILERPVAQKLKIRRGEQTLVVTLSPRRIT
ncbi:MAG TPA: aspartyl protease family protein [Pyrinomonadaceae bacterium]|nr:aspartyl protease family protein [Pyrinomonadaceae bacterium]